MKGVPVLSSLIFGIFSLCAAIPVQQLQPPSGQGLMFMQYTQPESFERNAEQSKVFVAGNSGVTGSCIEDENTVAQTTKIDLVANSEDAAVSSVAESVDFPDEENIEFQSNQDFFDPVQVDEVQARVSEDEGRKVEVTTNSDEIATTVNYSDIPARKVPILSVSLAPVNKPLPQVLPKQQKKIFVELDTSQPDSFYVPATRRIIANNPNKQKAAGVRPDSNVARPIAPSPSGAFFPIDFGATDGGVIAIANSYSTGEGGSASSTATAYGRSDGFTRSTRVRSG